MTLAWETLTRLLHDISSKNWSKPPTEAIPIAIPRPEEYHDYDALYVTGIKHVMTWNWILTLRQLLPSDRRRVWLTWRWLHVHGTTLRSLSSPDPSKCYGLGNPPSPKKTECGGAKAVEVAVAEALWTGRASHR